MVKAAAAEKSPWINFIAATYPTVIPVPASMLMVWPITDSPPHDIIKVHMTHLTVSDISANWDHTVFVLLWPTSYLQVHPCCHKL